MFTRYQGSAIYTKLEVLTSFHSHPRGGRKRRHGRDNYWPTPRQKSTEATHFRSQFQGRFPAPKKEPCV